MIAAFGFLQTHAGLRPLFASEGCSKKLVRVASVQQENDRCPYCHDSLSTIYKSGNVACKVCNTGHHTECWNEHTRCSVHGCASTQNIITQITAPQIQKLVPQPEKVPTVIEEKIPDTESGLREQLQGGAALYGHALFHNPVSWAKAIFSTAAMVAAFALYHHYPDKFIIPYLGITAFIGLIVGDNSPAKMSEDDQEVPLVHALFAPLFVPLFLGAMIIDHSVFTTFNTLEAPGLYKKFKDPIIQSILKNTSPENRSFTNPEAAEYNQKIIEIAHQAILLQVRKYFINKLEENKKNSKKSKDLKADTLEKTNSENSENSKMDKDLFDILTKLNEVVLERDHFLKHSGKGAVQPY